MTFINIMRARMKLRKGIDNTFLLFSFTSWFVNLFSRIKKRIPKQLSRLMLFVYVSVLVIGIILTIAYVFFHDLTVCSSLFGESFCTPLGIFIALTASLPGYIIVGNILKFFPELPWVVSLVIVTVVSGAFYFFLGTFIDRLKTKKITVAEANKIIIVVALFLLFLFLISLLE